MIALMLVAALAVQGAGAWEIIYASDDEMLLMLEAAEYRGNFRPMLHLHCKADTEPRVFFRPFAANVRLQFDDGEMILGRFTGATFGFAIEAGRLVEEVNDTGHVPMRHFDESAAIIDRMAGSEELTVRFQPAAQSGDPIGPQERNHFELAGLTVIFEALGNPCLPPG